MNRFLLLLALAVAGVATIQIGKWKLDLDGILEGDATDRFESFKKRFKHNCTDGTDACKQRKRNYAKNLKRLRELNETSNGDFEVEENKFMDWSDEELKQMAFQVKDMPKPLTDNIDLSEPVHFRNKRAAVPNFDWRTTNAVNPVRSQGKCGSCWAFATTAAIEIQMNFKNNRTGPLRRAYPEQYLIDCAWNNDGCDGGMPSAAMAFIRTYGTPRGAAYPYTSVNGKAKDCVPGGVQEHPIEKMYDLTGNVSLTMEYVKTEGPVTACFFLCKSFHQYKSGIYSAACNVKSKDYIGGHAVTIIGYGTNAKGVHYWLVRNSWGADWGLKGYAMIKRGANIASFETWELVGPGTAILP